MDIFAEIQDRLETRKFARIQTPVGEGSVCSTITYQTDQGKIFIKQCTTVIAMEMFHGEMVSLEKIGQTETIRAPRPMFVVADPNSFGGALVTEFLEMKAVTNWSRLANDLADMHLFNSVVGRKKRRFESWIGQRPPTGQSAIPETDMTMRKDIKLLVSDDLARQMEYADEFGFDVPTYCGRIPQQNEWHENWIEFYARNRLEPQVKMVMEEKGDREIAELWSQLQLEVDSFFRDMDKPIEPALLHGDLWSGNIGQLMDGTPVVFDPAAFYGHSEFELAIARLFGGFGRPFFEEYHRKLPKERGFDRRQELYQLFHLLNHWNHFGGSYRNKSLQLMRKLVQKD